LPIESSYQIRIDFHSQFTDPEVSILGEQLPRITVVTPSLNQSAYLEGTIVSVLSQDYPNLEYIVVDGGSTDGSVEIIEKYADHLAFWCSEPDRGQSHAINKGFARATGDILAWLNSDDYYEPDALRAVADVYCNAPHTVMVYGDCYMLYPDGRTTLKRKISFDRNICLYSYLMVPQPSAFWRRDVYEAVGDLREDLQCAMDYDLFLKLAHYCPTGIRHLRTPLSTYRLHHGSKSLSLVRQFALEWSRVRSSHTSESPPILWAKNKYYLLKAEWRFLWERHYIPLRKDRSKA
jgi:glycosyltransferase involved in cell wall biosynthesis